jgi:hypothetical protein
MPTASHFEKLYAKKFLKKQQAVDFSSIFAKNEVK